MRPAIAPIVEDVAAPILNDGAGVIDFARPRLPVAAPPGSPCADCGAPSTGTLGRHRYCADCREDRRDVHRGRVGGVGQPIGPRTGDLPPRWFPLACTTCGASWTGLPGESCRWCRQTREHQLTDQRHDLLWPSWIIDQGPRYEALSPIDKRVWDRTRNIVRGDDSVKAWTRRLLEAVNTGIVTRVEARDALDRAARR